MPYIDGTVAAVPAANKQAYIEHARLTAALFKAQGALSVVETWGDDVPTASAPTSAGRSRPRRGRW
jgi:uncharacterized protein YbaA (DUF1428 family)